MGTGPYSQLDLAIVHCGGATDDGRAAPRLRASQRASSTLPDADSNSTATAIQKRCFRHLQSLLVFFNFLWVRKTNKFPAEIKRITAARGRARALKHMYDPLDVERNL